MDYKKIFQLFSFAILGLIIGYGLMALYTNSLKKPVYNRVYQPEKWTYAFIMVSRDSKNYTMVRDSIKKRTPTHPNYFTMALYQANYFDYKPANYDVYTALRDVYKLNHLGEMDRKTKNIAMFYLNRAIKFGDKRAIEEQNKLEKQ